MLCRFCVSENAPYHCTQSCYFWCFPRSFLRRKKSSAQRTLLPRKSMQRGQLIAGETVSELFSLPLCMSQKYPKRQLRPQFKVKLHIFLFCPEHDQRHGYFSYGSVSQQRSSESTFRPQTTGFFFLVSEPSCSEASKSHEFGSNFRDFANGWTEPHDKTFVGDRNCAQKQVTVNAFICLYVGARRTRTRQKIEHVANSPFLSHDSTAKNPIFGRKIVTSTLSIIASRGAKTKRVKLDFQHTNVLLV